RHAHEQAPGSATGTRTARLPCRGDAAFHSSARTFMTAHTSLVRPRSTVLLESGPLRGKRVGILCNHASVDRGLAHIVDELSAADGVTLAAIFGPQHGFRSDVQD